MDNSILKAIAIFAGSHEIAVRKDRDIENITGIHTKVRRYNSLEIIALSVVVMSKQKRLLELQSKLQHEAKLSKRQNIKHTILDPIKRCIRKGSKCGIIDSNITKRFDNDSVIKRKRMSYVVISKDEERRYNPQAHAKR